MNIHVPQTLEAQTELRMLSATKHHIVSAQASKPNICIVQDSLLGAYKMTLSNSKKLRKEDFFNITMCIEKYKTDNIMKRIQHIRRVLKLKGKKTQCFNGRGLVSLILPIDLIYEKKNNGDVKEPIVKIYQGVMYEGVLNKVILGSTHNSLIHILNKEYSPDVSAEFIDNIQFITNQWLLIFGFSVGIEDCLVQKNVDNSSKEEEINDVIQKCLIEAEGIKETTNHRGIREMRINAVLNKAKDIGLRIAKDALKPSNNFLKTVNSGSKGDFFNITQITGLLGQQNLVGQRVPLAMNNGKRSLPHYPFGKLDPDQEYESRGFIRNSFIKALNPKQFYFHAMSGREGICDTAMGTARSGYMQRKIVKMTEDIKVQYDGTVRDEQGRIYQFVFGEDGMDASRTMKVQGGQEPMDITRMVNRLNMKHEAKQKN
jgi:DNA-directed RNA polymerase beta' subunit